MLIYGTNGGPTPEAVRAALWALPAGAPLVWWAVGVPLTAETAPARVVDHLRWSAPPVHSGPHFTPMRNCYHCDAAPSFHVLPLGRTTVVDVAWPEALSPAERRVLCRMGAGWAVCGATAATLVARRLGVPVVGFVSDAETLREVLSMRSGKGKGAC